MSVTIVVAGRPPLTTSESQITIGSHPSCVVSMPESADIKAIHAIIHEVDGRWVIESCKGDLLVVGSADPEHQHELKPGDVIQLSSDSPRITFQPLTSDFLPLPSTEPDEFRLLPLDDAPTSSGTIKARRPPSSTSIPTAKAPSSESSDRIRATKSPSSGSLPTPKSRTSGTIRSVDSESASKAVGDAASKPRPADTSSPPKSSASISTRKSSSSIPARKSDSNLPSAGQKRPRSSGQIPVHNPTDDDAVANVPVLQRTSSWEEELPPAPRRGRSSHEAEMKWIMMVVGRSLGGGAALLVCWIAVSLVWKELSSPPTQLSPSEVGAAVTEVPSAPVTPVAPYVPPRPKLPANVEKEVEKSSTTVAATPSTPETTNSETASTTTTETSKGNGKTDEEKGAEFLARIDSEAEMAVTPLNPVNITEPDEPDEVAISPLQLSSMDSIYAIVMEDQTGKRIRQIGTAWAASPSHLVTTATIARSIEEARQQSRNVYAFHPTSERKLQIAGIRMHHNYRQAARAVDEAIERRNEKKQVAIQKAQVKFDLAVLNLSPADRMEGHLQIATAPVKNSKDAVFSMVGLPYEKPDPRTAVPNPPIILKERHSQKPLSSAPLQNKDQSLTIQFTWHEKDPNWSGSPVLNKDHEVIGVYAQLPLSKTADSRKGRPESAVVWMGIVKDFAADLEKISREIAD